MKLLKKLFVFSIIIILIMIIYKSNTNNKINYLSLGDGISRGIDQNGKNGYGYSDYVSTYLDKINLLNQYNKKFSEIDNRITDIIDNIDENKEVIEDNKKVYIKQLLKHADIITISLGQNELLYKYNTNNINKEYINEMTKDLEKLIKKIKIYNKSDIFLIGFYNPFYDNQYDNIIKYANNSLIDLCIKEKLIYIDTYNLFKNNNYLINTSNYYPNKDGYMLIGREIIKKMDKKLKNIVNNKNNG